MTRRILIGIVFTLVWPAATAMARIDLPQGAAPTDDGQLHYFALDGARALAYDTSDDIIAVPLDGSATNGATLPAIASFPKVTDPMCASGDPEDQVGGGESIATGERHLIAWGFSGCKLGDGNSSTVDVAGPATGPFTHINLDPCVFGFAHVAISSQYAACADPDSALIQTSSLVDRSHTRRYTPPVLVRSLRLAGRFMAVASNSSIVVSDLRTGARTLRVRRRGPLVYAIGDDGTLVVGRAQRAAGPCRTLRGLAWYSRGSLRAHPIHARACARQMFLIGHKLVFQAPAGDSTVAIKRVPLAGSRPVVLARYNRSGVLLDADATQVLATEDCQGNKVAFVAPGGPGADPGSLCG